MDIKFGSLGVLLAIAAGIITVILAILGRIDPVLAGILVALALARVLP